MSNPYEGLMPISDEPSVEATATVCADHPEAGWVPGFGYAGGGFGAYKVCNICNRVFGKK